VALRSVLHYVVSPDIRLYHGNSYSAKKSRHWRDVIRAGTRIRRTARIYCEKTESFASIRFREFRVLQSATLVLEKAMRVDPLLLCVVLRLSLGLLRV